MEETQEFSASGLSHVNVHARDTLPTDVLISGVGDSQRTVSMSVMLPTRGFAVTIELGAKAAELHLAMWPSLPDRITIIGAGIDPSLELTIEPDQQNTLTLRNVAIATTAHFQNIELLNSQYSGFRKNLRSLRLNGSCVLEGPQSTDVLIVGEHAELRRNGTFEVRSLEFEGTEKALTFDFRLDLRGPYHGADLTTHNGATLLVSGETQDSLSTRPAVTYRGSGMLEVAHNIEGVKLVPESPGDNPPTLAIREGVYVREASGVAVIAAEPGSGVVSASDQPLRLTGVLNVADAEIVGVDIYSLNWFEVRKLEPASRFSFWHPGSQPSSNRRARLLELASTPQAENAAESSVVRKLLTGVARLPRIDSVVAFQQTDKWKTVARLAAKSGSTSSASYARYAHNLWRLRALRADGRRYGEIFWLSLYWLVGFGERLIRPLLAFGGSSFVLALVLSIRGGVACEGCEVGVASNFYHALVAPFSVLRLSSPFEAESAEVLVARLIGIICLGLFAVAVRRLIGTEAE